MNAATGRNAMPGEIAQHGVLTLRISATEVMQNLEGVLTHILQAVAQRIPPSL